MNNMTEQKSLSMSQSPQPKVPKIEIVPSKLSKLTTLDEDEENDDQPFNVKVINENVTPIVDDEDNLENVMGSIGDMTNMNRIRSDLSNKSLNIIKYDGDDVTDEIKAIYEDRLFAKNSEIMKETKGNSQINLLVFKFLEFYDVLNDEVLIITPDLQTTTYFKSIGLCKGYHVSGLNGLRNNDIEKIQKYL